MASKKAAAKKANTAPAFINPPAVEDRGARMRSGRTSVRVSRLTLDTLQRVQAQISRSGYSWKQPELDECIYRLCKAALRETTEKSTGEQVPS